MRANKFEFNFNHSITFRSLSTICFKFAIFDNIGSYICRIFGNITYNYIKRRNIHNVFIWSCFLQG